MKPSSESIEPTIESSEFRARNEASEAMPSGPIGCSNRAHSETETRATRRRRNAAPNGRPAVGNTALTDEVTGHSSTAFRARPRKGSHSRALAKTTVHWSPLSRWVPTLRTALLTYKTDHRKRPAERQIDPLRSNNPQRGPENLELTQSNQLKAQLSVSPRLQEQPIGKKYHQYIQKPSYYGLIMQYT